MVPPLPQASTSGGAPEIALLRWAREIEISTGLSDRDRWLASIFNRSEQEALRRGVARTDDRIRWRERRVSPPKCFVCGSPVVDLVEPSRDNRGIVHPGCSGMFRICEAPWHFQPAVAYVIPSEGPEPPRGMRRLWLWITGLKSRDVNHVGFARATLGGMAWRSLKQSI